MSDLHEHSAVAGTAPPGASAPPVTPAPPAVGRPRSPGGGRAATGAARWLVPCCYLLAAMVLTWRLWAHPATWAQTGDAHDTDMFAWFMRYSATALAHGRLPALVTTTVNAPVGINVMGNTSLLLPGLVLAPVTLLAGPQVSLTVLLTLGFAGSAATLFWVLRRWGATSGAAALGGAVYGFSPALLDSATGHYNLQFAVLPPLIIDALLRIVTGRATIRTGVWLGALVGAQVFIGEELLAETAVTAVVLAAVAGAGRAGAMARAVRRARSATAAAAVSPAVARAGAALSAAAASALLICGHALWVQFHGPLVSHGIPWRTSFYVSHPTAFVTPPGGLVLHTPASAAAAAAYPERLPEYLAYLGYPLLILLPVAAARFWRDAKVRATALTWALLETFSFGGVTTKIAGVSVPGPVLPWHWFGGLPLLADMLPDRFAILADGAAAALLAFALDRARSVPARSVPARSVPARSVPARSVPARATAAAVVAALAVAPLLPLPLRAARVVAVPAGWQAVFARLRLAPDARVLVIPGTAEVMRWQSATGEPGTLIGGRCLAPRANGEAAVCRTGHIPAGIYLDRLDSNQRLGHAPPLAVLRRDLAYWRPAAVVVAAIRRRARLIRYLAQCLGRTILHAGHVFGWRLPRARPSPHARIAAGRSGPAVHRPSIAAAGG